MRVRDIDKVQLVKEKAIELIVRDGLEGFSMNKLAKACQISVGTLYIYYKDRDDLIVNVTIEEMRAMEEVIVKDFDPEMSFEAGLRTQWKNRFRYVMEKPHMNLFFDQLRSSSYQQEVLSERMTEFKASMSRFMQNAVARGEIEPLSFEIYWSLAFAPLYNLLRMDREGKKLDGTSFKITDEVLWKTFDLVIKALKR
ncbi:transcriptional regulator [Pedobacter sp. BAL39]|uniref:TetR/AcrR family transcriptional regulator n=1 Tax=Pedobacter sp. BAL39 TaxID=391596 RepID=UPI00015595E1|nr:TetR/AcrR family transcriptional regulator [Pedobacter sp. BAL39]EDM37689.1 transcriptional regulator [Pedobacter sp. BAL39]